MYDKRLFALRNALLAQDARAMWLTSTNRFFISDQVLGCGSIEWLSGFNGSSAHMLITENDAVLMTDPRYTDYAKSSLDKALFRVISTADHPLEDLFLESLSPCAAVSFDSWCLSVREHTRLQKAAPRVTFFPLKRNPFHTLPGFDVLKNDVKNPFYRLKNTSSSFETRYTFLQHQLESKQAFFCSDMSSLSWLFGLRSSHIPYLPVMEGYALLTHEGYFVWCPKNLLSEEIKVSFGPLVSFFALEDIHTTFAAAIKDYKVLYEPSRTPYAISEMVRREKRLFEPSSNVLLERQMIKDAGELAALRHAQEKEGIAWIYLWHWLATYLESGGSISEWDVSQKLETYRKREFSYKGPSFETIAAYGPNASFMHYHPTKEEAFTVKQGEMFLLDAGGHYYKGATTDTTRTFFFGHSPDNELKELYTRVLKGLIAHSTAVFPKGTRGVHLEGLARRFLWEIGSDYAHATGHGVGAFSNVHEPPTLSMRDDGIELRVGMTLTSEPGYYKAGYFGIRLENMVTVTKTHLKDFYTFHHETLIPFERSLILKEMLTKAEQAFLNHYHEKVLNTISPLLDNEGVREFLYQKTRPLGDDE